MLCMLMPALMVVKFYGKYENSEEKHRNQEMQFLLANKKLFRPLALFMIVLSILLAACGAGATALVQVLFDRSLVDQSAQLEKTIDMRLHAMEIC